LRTTHRDKRTVYYASYAGVSEIINENGEHTGEYEVHYTEPIKARMNVSGGRGAADVAMFGFDSAYARSIVTDDLDTPFNEEMVFWIEKDPLTEPHDYRVVGVSRTINQVVIALSEVHTEKSGVVSA